MRQLAKSMRGHFQQFPLFNSECFDAAPLSCVEQRLAEESPVGGVYESMRRQNLRETRKRLSRRKKKAAMRDFVALLLKIRLNRVDDLAGKTSCFRLRARDESSGVGGRQLFRCVIWLAEFIGEGLNEVRAFTQEKARRAFVERYRHEGGPSRMSTKTQGSLPHENFRQGRIIPT